MADHDSCGDIPGPDLCCGRTLDYKVCTETESWLAGSVLWQNLGLQGLYGDGILAGRICAVA